MITVDRLGPKALEVGLVGTLEKRDYELFRPYAEATIDEHGELDLLVHIPDKPRFTPAALWEDLKFDVAHFSDVGRVAFVSKDSSKEWLATISKPFTKAEVRFFEVHKIDAARAWVSGDGNE
ncbi:MAG: STAS/SEC14 domain-containing protein [Woeseiaceae bacterium]|nr:STAS/SEC14 domain-containing protein [Woeseiaceae bacterium]